MARPYEVRDGFTAKIARWASCRRRPRPPGCRASFKPTITGARSREPGVAARRRDHGRPRGLARSTARAADDDCGARRRTGFTAAAAGMLGAVDRVADERRRAAEAGKAGALPCCGRMDGDARQIALRYQPLSSTAPDRGPAAPAAPATPHVHRRGRADPSARVGSRPTRCHVHDRSHRSPATPAD